MPGYHSKKQIRQAKHVEESEKELGKSDDEAEKIAWATVNKNKPKSRGTTKRKGK